MKLIVENNIYVWRLDSAQDLSKYILDCCTGHEIQYLISGILLDPRVESELKNNGWTNESMKEDNDNCDYEDFYIINKYHLGGGMKSLKQTNSYAGQQLGKDDYLVLRTVKKESLKEINPRIYKAYQKSKQEINKAKEKRLEKQAKTAEARKIRRIKAAKELLKKEGIIDDKVS